MSRTEQAPALADQILQKAESGATAGMDGLWLELLEQPPTDPSFYDRYVRAMRKAGEMDEAQAHIVSLMEQLLQREDYATLYTIGKAVARFWSDSPEVRKLASKALKGVHGNNPNFSAMIAGAKGLPLDKALDKFESYLLLMPGNVYAHAYWGEGIIKEVSMAENKVVAEFPEETKTLPIDFFQKHLRYVAPDSFLALRATNIEKLQTMAYEEPAALVKLALAGAGGRLKQTELKDLILNGVLAEGSWNTWWAKVRNELRMDPIVDIDPKGGAKAEVALRAQPKTFEEEINEVFFAPDVELPTQIGLVAEAQKGGNAAPDLVGKMLRHIEKQFAASSNVAVRLQYALMRQDLEALAPGIVSTGIAAPAEVLAGVESYELLLQIDNSDYAIRALRLLLDRDGDSGISRAGKIFPLASSRLAQAIWREMDKDEHVQTGAHAMRRLLDEPLKNPDTFAWAARNLMEKRWPYLEDHIPLSSFVPELLDNISEWQHRVDSHRGTKQELVMVKNLVGKMRSALQVRNFGPITDAAEHMTIEQVQQLRNNLKINDALNDAFRNLADRALTLTRRDLQDLAAAAKENSTSSIDGDLHWTTARAREEKLAELRELTTVTIPANSMEIEKARSEGDLKENAGYIYAKEKQKLLMQQMVRLQQDIEKARIFPKKNVKTDAVSFGVHMVVDNLKTQKQEKFTVLGRFETNPDKNILSYQSPFMDFFVGKKVGDEVLVKHPGGGETRYVVREITNAVESGEWDGPEESEQR